MIANEPRTSLRPAAIGDLAFASRIYLETMRYITNRLSDFDEGQHMARFAERFLPEEVTIIVRGAKDVGWLHVSETSEEMFL